MRIDAVLFPLAGILPFSALAEPIAFECEYSLSVGANISQELGVQTDIRNEQDLEMRFVAEPGAKQAQLIGNNGAANVIPVWGDGKVTFVEITATGTVQTTVIYGLGFGKKASAHSRTSGGEGYEMPSQYYGFCDVR